MNHVFRGYAPYKGDIPGRSRGSLVAFEQGETTPYGIYTLQDRGVMFISPNQMVYEGMIIGENTRELDMDVNPCKKKNVSNMRSSSSDEAIRLTPPRLLSLEQALDDSPVLVEHGRRKLNVLYRASMILGVELRQGIQHGRGAAFIRSPLRIIGRIHIHAR